MEKQKALRHFGLLRRVEPEQASLDKRLVRILFRHGALGEGVLAAKAGTPVPTPEFQGSMARLQEYRLIEVESKNHGNCRVVYLSPDGKGWGMDLTCEHQREEQERQEKEFREVNDKRLRAMGFSR